MQKKLPQATNAVLALKPITISKKVISSNASTWWRSSATDKEQEEMVFYFSATGNSKYVAERIGREFGGQVINISDATRNNEYKYQVEDEEKVFFIFPVYSMDFRTWSVRLSKSTVYWQKHLMSAGLEPTEAVVAPLTVCLKQH